MKKKSFSKTEKADLKKLAELIEQRRQESIKTKESK